MSQSFKVVQVGSHLAEISIGGAKVPLGFLASLRKKKHFCERGNGFLVKTMPGTDKKTYVVCSCATDRAAVKLRQVGVAGFESLAREWLVAEEIRIAENREKCHEEGYAAAAGAICPYPKDTDQALAWEEGKQARRDAGERSSS